MQKNAQKVQKNASNMQKNAQICILYAKIYAEICENKDSVGKKISHYKYIMHT